MVELESDPREERALFDGDELVDLRSNTASIEAGDLIEIRYDEYVIIMHTTH